MAWLIDHRGDFELAARKALGASVEVSWDAPRLVIVASNYTKYDQYAIGLMPGNIQLLRYQRYEDGTLVLDNTSETLETKPKKAPPAGPSSSSAPSMPKVETSYDLDYHLANTNNPQVREAVLELRERILPCRAWTSGSTRSP